MQLLGMKPKAGQKVTLDMRIRNTDEKSVQRTFTVSGVMKADPAMNVGFALVSKAYLKAYEKSLLINTTLPVL